MFITAKSIQGGFLLQVLIHHPILLPLHADHELQVDGVVDLLDLHHLHQGDGDVDVCRDHSAIDCASNRRDVLVVVVLEDNQVTAGFIRLVPAVGRLAGHLVKFMFYSNFIVYDQIDGVITNAFKIG